MQYYDLLASSAVGLSVSDAKVWLNDTSYTAKMSEHVNRNAP